jgi:nitrogen fixation NifU-like protein
MEDPDGELGNRLRALYSDTTVDHVLHPRNNDSIPNADGFAEYRSGDGESLKIWLRVRQNAVERAGFWTNGCAATIACGSMATELVQGKSVAEALAITADDIAEALGNLPQGNFHCAELAADTLRNALRDYLSVQRQPWKRFYRE